MIDLLSKAIELLEKLSSYFQKRYPKETGIYIPGGAQRSQWARFLADVSTHLLVILDVVLLLITGIRIWFVYNYYVFLYKLNSSVYINFANAFGEIKILLSLVALTTIVFIFFVLFSRRKRLVFREVFWAILLMAVGGLTITNNFEIKVEDYIKAEAYYLAFRKFENLEFESARDVFTALEAGSRSDEVGLEVRRALAEANLNTGNVQESIVGLTDLISRGSYTESSGEVLLLHTSIYALGKTMPLDEALNFIDELKRNYNVKELSPIWLGIDPQNNLHFIWDYVGDFEAKPADRIVLRILISKYPNDYYVDLARFASGEFQYVADNNPDSVFRDWCLYRTSQVTYRKQDFNATIKYLTLFMKEFPNHRWADDAMFRLARSYELSGHPEYALDLLLFSDFFPDGNWMEVIRTYRIALIDYYFDSQELRNLIANHQNSQGYSYLYLPTLDYSLAEQLFKEGAFEEARQQFVKVNASYPETVFAKYANQNIQILTRMIEIKNNSGNNWPVELAKFVMTPYNEDGNYDDYMKTTYLVIYNDLYEGKRQQGINYIGWSGAPWEYFYQANDYLWAEKLLEKECGKCTNPDEVLYLRLLAYYNLTFSSAFVPSYPTASKTFGSVSDKLDPEDYSSKLILDTLDQIDAKLMADYPKSKYAPDALAITAIGHANQEDYERTAQLMSTFLILYPDNSLANNASIYIARAYRKLATKTQDPTLKAMYYSKSQNAYEMTIKSYPSGHVGEEALEELNKLMLEMK